MDALENLYVGNFVFNKTSGTWGLVVEVIDDDTVAVQYENEPFGKLKHESCQLLMRGNPFIEDHF